MFKIPWLRSLLFLGLIELDMSNLTYFQNPVYWHRFSVFEIFVRLAKTDENVVCSTSYMAAHINVRPQGRVMDRGTVQLYLSCDHCWLPSPRLGDWRWIFECFCRLSPKYTYLTCRNFVCQHSVMAETTLKPRAFVFIVSEFSNMNWETRRYFWRSGKHAANFTCRDSARLCCVRLAEKLALVAFRLFPRPPMISCHWVLWSHRSGTSVCRFKSVPTWWLRGPIKRVRGTQYILQPEY